MFDEAAFDEVARNSSTLDLFHELRQIFLHAAHWGTPEYEQLDEHDRGQFTVAVDLGTVTYGTAAREKELLRRDQKLLRDEWIAAHGLGRLKMRGGPLPAEEREKLNRIAADMASQLKRMMVEEEVREEKQQKVAALRKAETPLAFEILKTMTLEEVGEQDNPPRRARFVSASAATFSFPPKSSDETDGEPYSAISDNSAADASAFYPIKEALDDWKHPGDYKAFNKVVGVHPWIRVDRTKSNRPRVHAGDWARFRGMKTDPVTFEQLPDDVKAEIADAVIAERESRKAEIRASRMRK